MPRSHRLTGWLAGAPWQAALPLAPVRLSSAPRRCEAVSTASHSLHTLVCEHAATAGFAATYWHDEQPFPWDYGVRTDGPAAGLPHFLDLWDTPSDPNIVTRWLLLDPAVVTSDSFPPGTFDPPPGIDCAASCGGPPPFPVPAPDSVRYPHVAGVVPDSGNGGDVSSLRLPRGHTPVARQGSRACPFARALTV